MTDTEASRNWKCVCGNTPCDGLDCGVYLPGQAPRKAAKPTTPLERYEIRKRAWQTRREKYGACGHG